MFIVTFCLTLKQYSVTPITNDTLVTTTFNTNTHSADVDAAYMILTSMRVVQNQRNANPNVESNATQRHLYTRKRNPEFDWRATDGTKAFGIMFAQEDCDGLHVTACTWIHQGKFTNLFWENETHKAEYVATMNRMMNGYEFEKQRGHNFNSVFATPVGSRLKSVTKRFRVSKIAVGSSWINMNNTRAPVGHFNWTRSYVDPDSPRLTPEDGRSIKT